ncbi:MAG: hypothetical protein KAT46_00580, partial [Deltaproteobacteria bacterium]|nr:hypothetical protein [Deltaproteobacteria bacterium]
MNIKAENLAFPAMLFALLLTLALVDIYKNEGYEVVRCTADRDCKLLYSSCGCEAILKNNERIITENKPTCDINECL